MSNKNLTWLVLIAILFLAGISNFSAASSEDFAFYSQRGDVAACSCGLTADTYTVRNTGAITSTYQLVKSGSASAFSTFSEDYFSLEPGQSKEIINYINLPCSASGNYNLVTNLSTLFGASKEFEQKISAGQCINFQITPKQSVQEKCPCSPTTYELQIENTGSFEETYTINVTTQAQYASLSESIVKLAPGSKKTVFVIFNLPCGVFGKQGLKVDVIAEKSRQIAEIPLTLDIGSCYGYSIQSDSQFKLCEGSNITTPVKITNKAGIANTFTITASRDFSKITNGTIFLWANESGSALLTVDASKLAQGNYDFSISSVSDRGNDVQSIDAKAEVEKCYDFTVDVSYPEEKLVSGKEYSYNVDIANTGTRQARFDVSSLGQGWVTVLEKNFTLNSDEVKTVAVKADIPANVSGKNSFKIAVNSEGFYGEKEIGMNIIDADTAYRLDISEKKTKIGAGASEIAVVLKNKGIAVTDYNLELTGPPWMQLSEKSVYLAPKETKIITILANIPQGVEEGKYVASILASVPESEIGYSKDFEVKVEFSPWYKKAYSFAIPYAAAYWPYALIVVGAILVLALLVWLIKKIAKRRKERAAHKPLIIEEKIIREEEPVFREFVPSVIGESLPFRLSLKGPSLKRKFDWGKFFRVFFILLVIAGIASLVWLNSGSIQDYASKIFSVKNETGYAPEVNINRSSGIEGYGNVIYIRETGDLDIPITIKNKAPAKVLYAIRIANSSFISSDASLLELDINETKTLHLIVHATPELSDGIYEINLGLSIDEKDLKYSEKIELRIEKQKSTFERYLPYIIVGIALAFVLILILALTRKSKFEAKKEKLDISIARTKERNWKKPLGIAVLIIAVVFIGYAAYSYVASLPEPVKEEGSIDLSSFENQSMSLNLKSNQVIIIPMTFENRFSNTARFEISSDAGWIDATDTDFSLSPGASRELNITAEPGKNVKEGVYSAEIKGTVEGQSYSKKISFYLRNSYEIGLLQNRYFIIGVIIIIFGIIVLFSAKKRKTDRKKFIQEIRQEITEVKAKPEVQRKTKIKLGPKKGR